MFQETFLAGHQTIIMQKGSDYTFPLNIPHIITSKDKSANQIFVFYQRVGRLSM